MTKCIRRFVSQKATKLSLVLIIFATFSNASLDIKTPKSEKISSLMLVGNSFFYYNNSLHNHLGDLIKNDPKLLPKVLKDKIEKELKNELEELGYI